MERPEKLNPTLRAITGGIMHQRSIVFHISTEEHHFQYTVNHLHSKTINTRYVLRNVFVTSSKKCYFQGDPRFQCQYTEIYPG